MLSGHLLCHMCATRIKQSLTRLVSTSSERESGRTCRPCMSRIACVACSGVSKRSSPAHLLMPVLGSVRILQDSSGPNACIAQHLFKLGSSLSERGRSCVLHIITWREISERLSHHESESARRGPCLAKPHPTDFLNLHHVHLEIPLQAHQIVPCIHKVLMIAMHRCSIPGTWLPEYRGPHQPPGPSHTECRDRPPQAPAQPYCMAQMHASLPVPC